jgi:hypothetical protein
LKLHIEIGRFFVTAIAVSISLFLLQFFIGLMTGENVGAPFPGVIAVFAFFVILAAGVVVGLPALWVARVLGWHTHLWKLSALGILAGMLAGAGFTVPLYGSTDAFEYPLEVLAFWLGMGAFSGLVAAQAWFWLHKADRTLEDA